MRDQWWAFPAVLSVAALVLIGVYVAVAAVQRWRKVKATPRLDPDAEPTYTLPAQPDDWRRRGPYRYPDEEPSR
jgi:hypothetical protein